MTPIATIRAYLCDTYAIIRIRRGLTVRHHRVSIRRYHAVRNWTAFRQGAHVSGLWLRDRFTAHIWSEPYFPDLVRRANLSEHMFLKLQAD
jgi:hypothetical protein